MYLHTVCICIKLCVHLKHSIAVFGYITVAGVTILLSLSVFSLMIADALPQTSEAIPLLGQTNYLTNFSKFSV